MTTVKKLDREALEARKRELEAQAEQQKTRLEAKEASRPKETLKVYKPTGNRVLVLWIVKKMAGDSSLIHAPESAQEREEAEIYALGPEVNRYPLGHALAGQARPPEECFSVGQIVMVAAYAGRKIKLRVRTETGLVTREGQIIPADYIESTITEEAV